MLLNLCFFAAWLAHAAPGFNHCSGGQDSGHAHFVALAQFLRGVFQKPQFGLFWHMRLFINAMLVLAVTGVLGGIVPLSARHLAELHSVQAKSAAGTAIPALRPAIFR
jgi:hypothetical protein